MFYEQTCKKRFSFAKIDEVSANPFSQLVLFNENERVSEVQMAQRNYFLIELKQTIFTLIS